jgi:enoyl-CoA hydratase/carnithine racemase
MVRTERRDDVWRATLDDPRRLNAVTGEDYRLLRLVVQDAMADASVRAVVITGTGRAFCAGADRALVDGSAGEEARRLAGEEFGALFELLASCDVPVVAAVNGLAVGVGATLLLHCDLVVLAESARLRFPFTSLGVTPEAGSSALLPSMAPGPSGTWAMLSSAWVDAEQARSMGLAWRVVADDDLTAAVEEALADLGANPPAAVRATKRLLTAGRADVVRAAMARELDEMRALTHPPPEH